jgi:hypothetical protein
MKRTILMAALAAAAPLCGAQISTTPAAPGTVTPGSTLGSSGSTLGQPGSTLGTPSTPGVSTGSPAIPSTGSFNRPGDTTLPGTPTTPGLSTLPGIGSPRDPLDRNSSTGSSSLGSSPAPTFRSPSPLNCIPGSITNPC